MTTLIIEGEEEKNLDYYIQVVCKDHPEDQVMKDPRTGDILCLICFQVCTEENIIDNRNLEMTDHIIIDAERCESETSAAFGECENILSKECINVYCLNRDESLFVSEEKNGDIICTMCGTSQIVGNGNISEKPDWNNYSTDENKSRVSYYDNSNLYYTLGTKIENRKSKIKNGVDINGNVRIIDLSKLQYNLSSVNSSKEQSMYKVISYFDSFKTDINPRVLDRAKIIWNNINQKFLNHHRGDLRKGILCNCVVQAGIELSNHSMFRRKDDIKNIMGVNDNNYLRSEKVFKGWYLTTTNRKDEKKRQIQTIFENIIQKLNLDFHYSNQCVQLYEKCIQKPRLADIRMKSLVAAIIIITKNDIPISDISKASQVTVQTILKTKNLITTLLYN